MLTQLNLVPYLENIYSNAADSIPALCLHISFPVGPPNPVSIICNTIHRNAIPLSAAKDQEKSQRNA